MWGWQTTCSHRARLSVRNSLRGLTAAVCGLVVGFVLPTAAEAEPKAYERPRLQLSGALSMGMASSNRLLDDDQSVSVPRAALKLTHALAPGVYFRYDAVASSRDAHGGKDPFAFREAYLNYSDGPLDFRIGLQTIPWGRTDVLNPTDNLTPYRYIWLTMTDADQRVGSAGVKLSYRTGLGQVTAVALPIFRPSLTPLGDTGPVTVREKDPDEPAGTVGLRWEQQAERLEWSVSYLHGRSLRPNLVPAQDFGSSLAAELQHPKVDIWGADFAAPWRSLIIRGEAAYTRADDCCDYATIEFRKRDNAFAVLGVETAVISGWRLLVQGFHKQSFEEAAQLTGASPVLDALARGSDILNEEVRSELSGLSLGFYPAGLGTRFTGTFDAAWVAQTNDYVLRPRLTAILSDAWTVNLAADLYDGDKEGPLGRLSDNSLVMGNVQYSFSRDWGR